MNAERTKILTMLAEGKISVDEADRLLTALAGKGEEAAAGSAVPAAKKARYLRVVVRNEAKDENVNIRVPLALIRGGIRLGSIIPDHARQQVASALRAKGIAIDPGKSTPEAMEELITALTDLEVDIKDGDGETVRVFCE